MFQPQPGEYIEVIPAYGRDFKNKAAIEDALRHDLDFQITTTRQYISVDEMIKYDFKVIVRYGKLMKTADMTTVVQKIAKERKQ